MAPSRSLFAALLFAGLTLPAAAAGWGHYVNDRFGFSIDVPPGFIEQGESVNGDGDRFTTPTAELRAFGGFLVDAGFEDEARLEQSAWTDAGWAITYQVTTPNGASFSGKKGARIIYGRLVPGCGADAFSGFTLDYSRADIKPFDALIERLVRSLTPPAC